MPGYVHPVCALGYTWGAADCGREAALALQATAAITMQCTR
jgi:hypothetical protein